MKALTLIALMMLSTVSIAAGGGSMPSMTQQQVTKTPLERAVASYNAGIKNRDKADNLQKKAVLETEPKKIAKLERKAIKQYKRAIKKFRSAIKNEPRLYQAHGSLGYALKQTGDFGAAMDAYNECLTLQPNYTPAIEYRGEAYLALGQIDKTRDAYLQLTTMDPQVASLLQQAIQDWLENPPVTTTQEVVLDMRQWFDTNVDSG